MPAPEFRADGAVKITLRGAAYWLSADAVLKGTFRVAPERAIQANRNRPPYWVTIRRKRYPVGQVIRLALGVEGGLPGRTNQQVQALRHLGFRVEQDPPAPAA